MTRAKDIADLEKMLNDGEGDSALNERAIQILERLEYDMKIAQQNMDVTKAQALTAERADFQWVVAEILRRRHEHVLDTFVTHLKNKLQKRGRP